MTGFAPIECGTEGLTADVKVAPILDEWEAPMVDEVDTSSKMEGVPSIVETMALIDDIVGVASKKRLGLMVFGGGVTPTVDGVKVPIVSRLSISVVKDTMEVVVKKVDPSISRSVDASPNVGLSGSK